VPNRSDRRVPHRKDTLTHEVTETEEVVVYDGGTPQLLVLNDIAAGVWMMIDGHRSVDDITSEILRHVEAERSTVTRDVRSFLDELEARKLIAWDREP